MAAAKGPMHALRGTGEAEKLLKNAKTELWNEHEEIGNYLAIESLAEALRDRDTAKLAREYRRQEERMASFLQKLIPQLTKAVVTEEVPPAQRRPVPALSSTSRPSKPAKSRAKKPAKSRATSRSSKPAKSRASKPAKRSREALGQVARQVAAGEARRGLLVLIVTPARRSRRAGVNARPRTLAGRRPRAGGRPPAAAPTP